MVLKECLWRSRDLTGWQMGVVRETGQSEKRRTGRKAFCDENAPGHSWNVEAHLRPRSQSLGELGLWTELFLDGTAKQLDG